MQENGIKAKLRRRFKNKKQQISNRVVAPNTLDQNFTTDQPNKVWDYLYKNQRRMAIFGNNN
ncbi:transposase [Wolbachia endosymbiont of Nasonia oneida]|uniref:transposase n=1 Tax=Wolbachia endosymbiont of Nasonia oneida TaxID=2175860 RepID=UPI00125066FB|nr:transposase [Wolbachia endosymbiont of Nasonia oneida]KAB2978250.1 transposase [Wolbachia endosymbiont of Nasonia oneida]